MTSLSRRGLFGLFAAAAVAPKALAAPARRVVLACRFRAVPLEPGALSGVYTWKRDGRVIRGATGQTLTIREVDVGRVLTVRLAPR